MISMSDVNSMRQMRRDGESVASIARAVGVSRDTVYKYLKKDDFSPDPPRVVISRPSKLDPYKPLIQEWLDQDVTNWKKQRHTARRIWQRLRDECGADVSEATVGRYVRAARESRCERRSSFLDLTWAPGEAQADFGEADFYVRGIRTRLSYFVLVFPYSNVGLAQVFPAENAECACEGLRRTFGFVGGVPARIVFDNAAGAGRRIGDVVRTTEVFGRCAAHYGFAYSFCNPHSGNGKGSVENKVGVVRRSLFVPVPQVWDMKTYNVRLLDACMRLSDKPHWLKGEPESQLFFEDRFAMVGLPERPFECVRYARAKADKKGKVKVDGPHIYSTAPELAGQELVLGLGALCVKVYDRSGTPVCEHTRRYGSAPTDETDPSSQLCLLSTRVGAWKNSQVRAAVSEDLRNHMDLLPGADLRGELRAMRSECARSGWISTLQATELAFASTGRVDEASVAMAASGLSSKPVLYDEETDLADYDRAMGIGR